MRLNDEVIINAPASAVWAVYADVERWPEWTASVRSVRFVTGDRVTLGARVRIDQPRLPTAEWEVTAVDDGVSWAWTTRAPGARTTAVHTLEVIDASTTRVRQVIEHTGPLAGLVGRAYGRRTRRYLAIEAQGLKQRCEAPERV